MSDGTSREEPISEQARQSARSALVGVLIRLSGPGWLGSAFTLGAGSLFLGVIGGYELVLKVLVALIVLSFLGVVIRLTRSGQLCWFEIASGFVSNWRHLFEPAGRFPEMLSTIQSADARAYWTDQVLETQRERIIAAASSTVAVNMCFLVPFSLLARKWNRSFRGLALFDLISGTLLPFILVTGCVVPRGGQRVLWNLLMAAALIICGGASIWTAWNLKLANLPVGRWFLVDFAAAILLGHLFMNRRTFWPVSQGGTQP